ncbi:hypothetical protein ABW286_11975, partial [Erwinia papayae]
HTQLNGAVIASTATADRNKLDTGTLGFSDIKNSAEYTVEHQSVGISSGGGVADGGVLGDAGKSLVSNLATGLLVGVNNSGSASSMTKAAVSEGTIIVRNQARQTQDVSKQVWNNFYDQAFTESGFSTGGKVQQAIQAATAVVQDMAAGDLVKAIAGGSAPYITNIIRSSKLDDSGKILAHAVVNASLAAAQIAVDKVQQAIQCMVNEDIAKARVHNLARIMLL